MNSPVAVEIYLRYELLLKDAVINTIKSIVNSSYCAVNTKIFNETLPDSVEFFRINCRDAGNTKVKTLITPEKLANAVYYAVVMSEGSSLETINDSDNAVSSQNWLLPSREFDGLWESLYYNDGIKERLLQYALTSLALTEMKIDPNIICCNRLLLLHGPPGTGKTTLCKALAQKISIRMSETFPQCQLVEVNCHSLFSKWFSESGKLVSKMFSTIQEYAAEPNVLVIVLIDEVESLTTARQAALNRNEPSDSIRVVNAVLTQLDTMRFLKNVIVLATSNLTEAIDDAFADRADIIQFVDLPGAREISFILESCLSELERVGLFPVGSFNIDLFPFTDAFKGLSGRMLRKLPLIALAEQGDDVLCPEVFLKLMVTAAERIKKSRITVSLD